MADPPGREAEAARTGRRWSWHGRGSGTLEEKRGLGLFLDDVVYCFADVSISALPALYVVMTTAEVRLFGAKGSVMVAWMTMVVVAALVRGGWVTPLTSAVPGWVSVTASLVALRFAYFNLCLAAAALGGASLADRGFSWFSVVGPFVGGLLAAGLFPRLAEACARRF